jgi:hypothetical protein
MTPPPSQLPGKGLLGWLGRQVGYVKGAARYNPTAKTLYKTKNVEECQLPDDPTIKLRRTTVDEVIQNKTKK